MTNEPIKEPSQFTMIQSQRPTIARHIILALGILRIGWNFDLRIGFMKYIYILALCTVFVVSQHGNAEDYSEIYNFRNDGFGSIENRPDDMFLSRIRIATFRNAEDFFLEPFRVGAFAIIEKLPNLTRLHIDCLTDPLSTETALLISKLKTLKVMTIENAVVSHEAIPILLRIPVQCLVLRCISVADQLHFLNLESLQNLTLRHCGLKNSSAAAIANSPKLQYLDVHGNEYISSEFIWKLKCLKELKNLHMTGVQLSLAECRHIVDVFPCLQYLNAETDSKEGSDFLESNLPNFTLLPPYSLGSSPMLGLE